MIQVSMRAAVTSAITIQDPYPTDGKLVIHVPADSVVTQQMTGDQYLRLKPYLNRYLESGALVQVLVNDLEADRSDEWVELKERTAKVATISTTGGVVPNLVTLGIRKGDVFSVYDAAPVPTTVSYTIAEVHSTVVFESETTVAAFNLNGAGDAYYITRDGVEITGSRRTVGVGGVTVVIATVSQTPYQRTDFGKFFVKASDGKPYFLMDDGTELNVGMTGSDPLVFKGAIAVNTDFPLVADVQNGWLYLVTADVTDNAGVLYTNTGQSFMAGSEIAWNGADWTELGTEQDIVIYDATPAVIGDANVLALIDTVVIAGPVAVTLPAAGAGTVNKVIKVVDMTGAASAADPIALNPDGTDTIDGVNAPVNLTQAYGTYTLLGIVTDALGTTFGWTTLEGVELRAATARLAAIGAGTQNSESFQHMPATEDLRLLRAKAAGVITGIHAECGTTLGVGETMNFDVVRRRGPAGPEVVMLTGTINFVEAQAVDTVVPGVLIADPSFLADDLLFARRTYVAGAGTLRDTVVGVQVRYN